MKQIFLTFRLRSVLAFGLVAISLVSCGPVDLNAPMPTFETGVNPNSWVQIPAGEFHLVSTKMLKALKHMKSWSQM